MRPRGLLRTRRRVARRVCAAGAGLAATLAVLPAAIGVLPGVRAGIARADDQTVSQDSNRDGWDQSETGLSPSVVKGGTFKALPGFPVRLNGQVYAQPVVVGHEVIVATENDMVYGINGATGHIDWAKSVGTPYRIKTCNNIAPNIGITGTPVYDPGSGLVYLVAQVKGGYKLFGVNPGTGAVSTIAGIGGRPSNDSHITFSTNQQLQRPGLLLDNGWVYAAFGSHCDHQPYAGYVAGVNLSTHATTLWTDEANLVNNQAGIWQSGGGMMAVGNQIYFTSGNGVSPAPGPGTSPPHQLAESIVRLANNGSTLSAKDFFSPDNAPKLDSADSDWGSGGPVGLPFGTSAYSNLIVQAGKADGIFVLNGNNLGGRKSSSNSAALAVFGGVGGQWGHPAAFGNTTLTPGTSGADDYLYYAGKSDYLRVLRFGANGSGTPTITDIANSASTMGYGSGGPVVTSNGNDPSTAVVWVVDRGSKNSGTLQAYPATPSSPGWPSGCTSGCKLHPLFSASTGTAASFATPATSNNAVYVGTLNGYLYGFGTPGAGAAPLGGPAATFSPANVGSASTRNVSVTARGTTTVTGVSAATTSSNGASTAAQFTVDASKVTETVNGSSTETPVTFPVTLHKGDTLTAPVAFSPASPGGVTGTLSFTTQSATQPSADVPLAGDGIQAGLYTTTPSVQFALVDDQGQFRSWVPVGISVPREIAFTNGGTTAETISTENLPSAPFSVTGLPPLGSTIQPGQSFVAAVWFTPTAGAQTYNDTLTVGTSQGSATVNLVSQSLSPSSLFQASPSSVNLGKVKVGKRATFTITVTNTGNEPATMNGSSTLNAPFHALYKVTPQLPVNAGYNLTLPVSFTPTTKGNFTTRYTISWTDVLGSHTLSIPVSGTGV
jgi:hypothetical protein